MSRKRRLVVMLAGLALLFGVVPANASHDDAVRVSVASGGGQATGPSFDPAVSADGRYITYDSLASDLVSGDTNGLYDVFVHDRQTGTTTRVSVATGGTQSTGGDSDAGSISADGRYIAFWSSATNLVAGDTNGNSDVFVHDRQTGTTTRVSVATGGAQATGGHSQSPAISADGRYVAYESEATNLVAGDTNGNSDVFVHDRQTGTTTRVSVATGGAQSDAGAVTVGGLSADGRYVAFSSSAGNLVSGDTNGNSDVFIHDRQTGTTTRVSVATGGAQATGGQSYNESLSSDGRYVAFNSGATNLVAGDTNGSFDVFVHDRQTGTTSRVSVATGGGEVSTGGFSSAISADGRFVAFHSNAGDLVAGDANGNYDVFVHDLATGATTRASLGPDGSEATGGPSAWPAISADGRFVAFHSSATNLVTGDTNSTYDVFVRHLLPTGVIRDAGANRYATAAALSEHAYPFGASTVYVAVGTNFPDALGAGPAAAKADAPLLLVQTDSIPGATATELTRLDPDEIIIVGGTGVISAAVQTQLSSYAGAVTRLWGPNRFATAAAISQHGWPGTASTVYLAVGTNFPDALGAGPAAAKDGAPLLLVQTDSIPPETLNELTRLAPAEIVIVGGTGVISAAVETQLAPFAALVVRRLSGPNRYATAAAIVADGWPGTADTVYVAVGTNFPDALGAGAVAAHLDGPLLLVQTDSIPGETATQLARLDPSTIVVVGGTGVISAAVETALAAYLP